MKSRLPGAMTILFPIPPGNGHQRNAIVFRVLSNAARRFIPVEAWHAEIEHYQIRLKFRGDFHRFESVAGDSDFVAHDLEQGCEHVCRILIVVRDQNAT